MEDIWKLSAASDASGNLAADVDQTGTVDIFWDLLPLDAQTNTAERKSVPESLRMSLFDPIDQAEPATFAILDAAKIPTCRKS